MAGRALRDSQGRYAGSTKGWGAGRSGGGRGGIGGGRSARKKGSGVPMGRIAAAQAAVKRGVSVGKPVVRAGLSQKSPRTMAEGAKIAVTSGGQAYRKARTGRL